MDNLFPKRRPERHSVAKTEQIAEMQTFFIDQACRLLAIPLHIQLRAINPDAFTPDGANTQDGQYDT
ncbi:MAG: hypothetical protein ACK4NW_09290 [Roseinatronobacter sp.]